MNWLSPSWLWLLLPWAALCVWGVSGGGRTRAVPFLRFWPLDAGAGRRRTRVPPLWAALLLLAALLAVLAAAGPVRRTPVPTLTVVVDATPGMTPPRVTAAIDRLRLSPGTVVRRTDRTDADAAVLEAALRQVDGPYVLIGDRDVTLPPGATRVSPPTPLVNAGIDRLAVVAGPHPQAMVRLFNGVAGGRARLRVDAVERAVDLPPGVSDAFVGLPGPPGDVCTATLLHADGSPWADDVPDDDRLSATRAVTPGRVVPDAAVSDALARMIAVYARHRVPAAGAPTLTVKRGPPPAGPAAVLAATLSPGGGAATVDADHPVSRSLAAAMIDWPALARDPAGPPGDGWRPLVRSGDAPRDRAGHVAINESSTATTARAVPPSDATPSDSPVASPHATARAVDASPASNESSAPRTSSSAAPAPPSSAPVLLAVRESPVRQVWVGFDADALADAPAYVAFWADVFDWLGGPAAAWTPGRLAPAARPAVPTPDAAGPAAIRTVDVDRPLSPWLLATAAVLSGFALRRLNLTES